MWGNVVTTVAADKWVILCASIIHSDMVIAIFSVECVEVQPHCLSIWHYYGPLNVFIVTIIIC